jgi:hypothetical protein
MGYIGIEGLNVFKSVSLHIRAFSWPVFFFRFYIRFLCALG